MKMHDLQPKHKRKERKRIGRGTRKRGTYSGRGIKGQRARAGVSELAFFSGGGPTLAGKGDKIVHKLRGEGNNVPSRNMNKWRRAINIEDLDTHFNDGDEVSVNALYEKGLIPKTVYEVKILGRGSSQKRFRFQDVQVSKSVWNQYSVS
ncbi:MAG: 50S ribosomal protein L15 [Parcubacteria group bacterium SW_4_49_11]|nr:MAG: 50S ribosomal protein L15 [Parcubacteria group bacterium SW_4_49_11]